MTDFVRSETWGERPDEVEVTRTCVFVRKDFEEIEQVVEEPSEEPVSEPDEPSEGVEPSDEVEVPNEEEEPSEEPVEPSEPIVIHGWAYYEAKMTFGEYAGYVAEQLGFESEVLGEGLVEVAEIAADNSDMIEAIASGLEELAGIVAGGEE